MTPQTSEQSFDESFERHDLKRLRLFLYLIPVVGFLPALWGLYQQQGDRREQRVSRMAIILGLTWALGSLAGTVGGQMMDGPSLPLLLSQSLLTSGYFLTLLWLMVQLGRGKSPWLPGAKSLGAHLP
jgi:hypothetical protein